MTETSSFDPCRVCGEIDHGYKSHMATTTAPAFVGDAVTRLRALEMSGSHIDTLVADTRAVADRESGGDKAWALWLLEILEELEEAESAPEVAEQIEAYLMGAFGQ